MHSILNKKSHIAYNKYFGGDKLAYAHLIAVGLTIIAAYLSFKAYRMFGSKTRKWFIFTLIGLILLPLSHIVEDLNDLFGVGISEERLLLAEHLIFFAAMISFILSYYIMIKSFEKSFPGILGKIK